MMLAGYFDSVAATFGMWLRWTGALALAFALADKCVGYRVEFLVCFGQFRQFEQRLERQFQQWQCEQQQ